MISKQRLPVAYLAHNGINTYLDWNVFARKFHLSVAYFRGRMEATFLYPMEYVVELYTLRNHSRPSTL